MRSASVACDRVRRRQVTARVAGISDRSVGIMKRRTVTIVLSLLIGLIVQVGVACIGVLGIQSFWDYHSFVPSWGESGILADVEIEKSRSMFVIAGWPFRALQGSVMRPVSIWNSMPRRVVPFGFVVNSVIYGGALWGIIDGRSAWIRRRRRVAGCCETCAYPFGESGRCPECGLCRDLSPSLVG